MKFAFYTLGCKTNQYETQAMEQLLRDRGHEIGSFEEACDGYIINTCSVTAVADKKNRAVVRRCRREHPEAVIAVGGCYVQHDPQALRDLGVDVLGGSGGRVRFIEMLLEAAADRCHREELDDALRRREFEVLPAGGLEKRTRAMVKVQDGCRNFCTYCIIPYTRGPVRSAPLELAVDQCRTLAQQGYREIVVTGIEIASWGVDLPGKPGPEVLIDAICRAVPDCRVRLGSLEPRIITQTFCDVLVKLPNLCPQFHLSMQSGSDTVLSRMKRKYDTARYLESVELLKNAFPGCAITTDMIVAFPGETEEEFEESLAFIRRCGFADMHIFPYSRRPGTPADKMPGQHPNAVKEARSKAAIAVAEDMSRTYRESLLGTVHEVLFEEPEGEYFTGHCPNYVKVYVKGENLHNEVRKVHLTAPYKDGMLGIVEEQLEVLDEEGKPTGKTVSRKEAHEKGILHGAAHTYLYRKCGDVVEVLLQRRSHNKDSFPDCLDISSAGHMEAGMGFEETAIKELGEELGLTVEKGILTRAFRRRCSNVSQQHGKTFNDQEINEIFLLRMDDLTAVKLQEEEVSEVLWLPMDTITTRLEQNDRELCIDKEEFREVAKAIKAQFATRHHHKSTTGR